MTEEFHMSAARKDKWVLVVEDDKDIRELLVEDLIDQFDGELRIVEASDGVQATGKLDNQAFDCIITDLKMPKRDGESFIEWVRESQLNKFSPVIIVTTYPEPHLQEKYPNVHILKKPVDFKQFGDVVKTQIKLGRLDNRISAGLFNETVSAAKKILSELSEAVPVVESPIVKPIDEDFIGDVLSYFSVKGHCGKCDIVFGFSQSFIDFSKSKGSTETSPEGTAMTVTSTIIKAMLTSYHLQHRNEPTPKIEKKIFLGSPTGAEVQALKKNSGLKIPITLFEHTLCLTMLNIR
ncbi:MAG: response regulator [Bdellovibrionales bacterium]|nr:response regulator [Bdellovibrionales bacterium]